MPIDRPTASEQIRSQPRLSSEEKSELLELIADIETEVDGDNEDADAADHPVKDAVRLTLEGASASKSDEAEPKQFEDGLLKLEANYPRTAAALGRIGHVLARMGI